jgi:hypothetical protein
MASRPNCASGSSLFSIAVFCLQADFDWAAGPGFYRSVQLRAVCEKHPFSAHHLYQGFIAAKSSQYSNDGPTFVFVVVHLLFAFNPNL